MNRLGISNESYFTNFVYRGPKMLEKQGKWLTGSPVAEQFKKHKNILKLKVIKNLTLILTAVFCLAAKVTFASSQAYS